MKATLLGVLTGIFGVLLVAELLCRVLPVSSATKGDYYIDPRIHANAPNLQWRYSTGWDLRNPQELRTNSHGFVSDHQFTRDPRAVALIGDSFVESASLDQVDRPAAQLERALGGRRPVYAMGVAGTALLDYAERVRYAHENFGVRDFVILMERGDVRQALCGSGNVTSQCLDPKDLSSRTESLPPASPTKRLMRESALAQYFASQLKIAPDRMVRQLAEYRVPKEARTDLASGPAKKPSPFSMRSEEVDAVTAAFFARVKPHISGRLVIAIDADRQALMRHRSEDEPMRQRFIQLARAAGAIVIDTEPIFREHFAQSTRSLDIGPYDGHFNPEGVRLVTSAIADAIK
jgi:hypothetical protein